MLGNFQANSPHPRGIGHGQVILVIEGKLTFHANLAAGMDLEGAIANFHNLHIPYRRHSVDNGLDMIGTGGIDIHQAD